MKLTTQIIMAGTGCASATAGAWLSPLQFACDRFNIRTDSAGAAFLCNIGVESGGLTQFVENMNYSAQRMAEVWPTRFAVNPSASVKVPNGLALELARKPEAIANSVYAGRLGNGTQASGEGWKYRGQGPIQITGKANFARCGVAIGMDLVKSPELIQAPTAGALSAAWFFSDRDCIHVADLGDIAEVVRRVNGKLPCAANNGPKRLAAYQAALTAMALR